MLFTPWHEAGEGFPTYLKMDFFEKKRQFFDLHDHLFG